MSRPARDTALNAHGSHPGATDEIADQSLQYLQQVIQDVHALVAHEPDPQLKATYAKCLQAFLTAQHQKMSATPGQPQAGQQQPQYSGGSEGGNGSNGIAQMLAVLGGGPH